MWAFILAGIGEFIKQTSSALLARALTFIMLNMIAGYITQLTMTLLGVQTDWGWFGPLTMLPIIITAIQAINDPYLLWAFNYMEINIMISWVGQAYVSTWIVRQAMANIRAAATAR